MKTPSPLDGRRKRKAAAKTAALVISSLLFTGTATGQNSGWPWEVPNGNVHEGTEVQIDYPLDLAFHNTATKGLGNCVWTSIKHVSYWQDIPELHDIISWLDEGGGYPSKVDKILGQHAPSVKYVQYEGPNPEAIIELALKTRRMVCMTYGYGKFYGPETISHMVNGVHLDSEKGAILDNNDEKHFTWMSRSELIRRSKFPSGTAWVIVFLSSPPPPVPTN